MAGISSRRLNVRAQWTYSLPEMVNTLWSWLCADVQEDHDIWLQERAKGIEKPAMRIDLLGILEMTAKSKN